MSSFSLVFGPSRHALARHAKGYLVTRLERNASEQAHTLIMSRQNLLLEHLIAFSEYLSENIFNTPVDLTAP